MDAKYAPILGGYMVGGQTAPVSSTPKAAETLDTSKSIKRDESFGYATEPYTADQAKKENKTTDGNANKEPISAQMVKGIATTVVTMCSNPLETYPAGQCLAAPQFIAPTSQQAENNTPSKGEKTEEKGGGVKVNGENKKEDERIEKLKNRFKEGLDWKSLPENIRKDALKALNAEKYDEAERIVRNHIESKKSTDSKPATTPATPAAPAPQPAAAATPATTVESAQPSTLPDGSSHTFQQIADASGEPLKMW